MRYALAQKGGRAMRDVELYATILGLTPPWKVVAGGAHEALRLIGSTVRAWRSDRS